MVNLTGLTASVSSAWSNNNSLYMYCFHDDTDYKINPDDLTQLLGRDGGCLLGLTSGSSIGLNVDYGIIWGSVYYESGAGWQNLANSPTILIAPFNGVVQLQAHIRGGGAQRMRCQILKNNTFNNTPYPAIKWVQYSGEVRNILTMPISVISGDYFTCVVKNETSGTSSLYAECIFSITPMGWT